MAYMAKEPHTGTTAMGGRASHPYALHTATLGLSVKGLLYCHVTERLTLALTGGSENKDGGERASDAVIHTRFYCNYSGYVCQPKIKLLI